MPQSENDATEGTRAVTTHVAGGVRAVTTHVAGGVRARSEHARPREAPRMLQSAADAAEPDVTTDGPGDREPGATTGGPSDREPDVTTDGPSDRAPGASPDGPGDREPGATTDGPSDREPGTASDRPAAPGPSVASRLFAILDAFSAPAPASSLSLGAISRRAGIPLSTTHRLVNEWVRWGGLARLDDGRYALGMRLWEVGVQAPTARNLRTIALPYLEDLYEGAREHVHLAVLDGRDALYIEKLSGHEAVHIISRVGGRLPLHSTGVGLVLLAWAPAAFVDEYLAGPLQKFLPGTVTDPVELRRRLAVIRSEGLSRMSEEMTAGSSSIAAPIRDRTGQVVAAASIVTRTEERPSHEHEQRVRRAARGVSRALGYRPDPA